MAVELIVFLKKIKILNNIIWTAYFMIEFSSIGILDCAQ